MKRRTFLKGMGALALVLPSTPALAQQPTKDAIDKLRARVTETLERTFELEPADPEQTEWIDGLSDGTNCTFDTH